MTCCICYEHAKKRLDCGHVVCRKCTLKYINTKWKQGDTDLNCPMCREKLKLICIISNGTPIFKYDKEIFFTISALGILEMLPEGWSPREWERGPSHRLTRCAEAAVRPILTLHPCAYDKLEQESI